MLLAASQIKRVMEWYKILEKEFPEKLNGNDYAILNQLKENLKLEEEDYGYCKHPGCNVKLTWRHTGGFCGTHEW